MITIIDYGTGNLKSVYNAFRYLGEDVKVSEDPADLKSAEKIVLPGVGSSKDAMKGLIKSGMIDPLMHEISKGKPFLGICLGLQLLFEESEETGGTKCMGLIKGKVKLFDAKKNIKVPQIGWNTIKIKEKNCPLLKGIKDESYFYFVHSYYCESKENKFTAGVTNYGIDYTSFLWKENIYAVQFHPERSQKNGIKLLENFVNL